MMKPYPTAYQRRDLYLGWLDVYVQPYRALRLGERVTMYRLVARHWNPPTRYASYADATRVARTKARVEPHLWRIKP